jgi:hypothetical protein
MKLVFTALAINQAEHIDSWWRENRRGSPGAFSEDFAVVIAAILAMPRVMAPFTDGRGRTVHRWLLARTKHHVYYTIDESAQTVRILGVWGWSSGFGTTCLGFTQRVPLYSSS